MAIRGNISNKVINLYNNYVIKQSRPVSASLRRQLSGQERQALSDLEANWMSGNIYQANQIQQLQSILQTEGVTGLVNGQLQLGSGYQGMTTREGILIEKIGTQQPQQQTMQQLLSSKQLRQLGIKELRQTNIPQRDLSSIQKIQQLPKQVGSGIRKVPKQLKEDYRKYVYEPYQKLESKTSEKLKQIPYVEEYLEKAEPFSQLAGETAPSWVQPVTTLGTLKSETEKEFQTGQTYGLITEPIQKPVKTAFLFGTGYAGGKAISFLGKTGIGGSTTGRILGQLGLGTMTGLYAGFKGVEISEKPSAYERGRVIGGTITTELLPLYAGQKFSEYDKTILKKVLESQKELLKDVEARAGRRTKTKQVQKKKTDKQIIKDLIDSIENDFVKKGKLGTDKRVKDISKDLSSQEARDNFADFLEELYNKRIISDYSYNTRTGELNFQGYPELKEPPVSIIFKETKIKPVKTPEVTEPVILPSKYAGTGQYERYSPSELLQPVQPKVRTTNDLFLGDNIFGRVGEVSGRISGSLASGRIGGLRDLGRLGSLGVQETRFKTGLFGRTGQTERTRQLERMRELEKEKEKQKQKQRTEQDLWYKNLLKSEQRLKEETEQKSRQRLKTGQIFRVPSSFKEPTKQGYRDIGKPKIPRFRKPRKPKKPTIPYFEDGEKGKKKIRKWKTGKGLFVPEFKRNGRWYKLRRTRSLEQARELARKKVLRTLSASFRIKKSGKVLPIKSKSPYFRPSKKQTGVLVQKKKGFGGYRGRLSSIPEREQIQLAKKKLKFFK